MSAPFWMGVAIGGIIVLLILLAIVAFAGSANEKKAKARNSAANDLLRERNAIGIHQVVALASIEERLEQLVTIFGDNRIDDRKQRRERIAVQFAAALFSDQNISDESVVNSATTGADKLIAKLDAHQSEPPTTGE